MVFFFGVLGGAAMTSSMAIVSRFAFAVYFRVHQVLPVFTGFTGFSKRPIRHPHLLKVTDFFQRKKKDDGPERNPYIGSHSTPSLVDPVRVLIF